MNHRPPVFRLASGLTALAAALLLAACGSDGQADVSSPAAQGTLRVAVTLPVFADFVREVGGDRADVFAILPAGADPHTYEPIPSDIRRITEADIIFVNDLEPGLEGSILDVIQNNKGGDTQVVAFLSRINTTGTEISDNPHLWLAPPFASAYAGIIEGTLAKKDPAGADAYGANLGRYSDELSVLDRDLTAVIDRIPLENRKLVTPHDAFPHFAQRYGMEIVGFVVPGPGQEPSSRDIADLTDAITDQAVPAVFVEPQIGPQSRLLEQTAADAGVLVCTLYSDTLNDEAPTYIDMMRFNADELLRCLGGAGG